MKKKLVTRAVSVLLAVCILAVGIPMIVSADTSAIHFGVVSDIHYYPQSLKGDKGEAWQKFVTEKQKEYDDTDSLLYNALDGILRSAVDGGENYVLIPGDLTKDGELEGHKALAAKLEAFEAETGIQVLVAPGNHDINNSNACTFENGVKEPAQKTSPEQFREIYKNLGYDLADSFFVPAQGKQGGMLSYAATLGEYRLIAIDSCMYSPDNGADGYEHLTDGRIGDELLSWIVKECEAAKAKGLTIIGLEHHNLIPHTDIEEATLWAFVVQDWLRVAETLADAGMHYMFTGHLHASDTVSHTSDNGETIYDILTPTLSGYPNYYRTVDFVSDGENIKMDMQSHDIDEFLPVVSDSGIEYPKPFKLTYSYGRTFGEGGVGSLVANMVNPMISGLFADISEAGGLLAYLKAKNIDVEKIITDALGTNGLEIGSAEILTVSSNLMGFIGDLAGQVDEVYINNPDLTLEKLNTLINKILDYQLSEYPAQLLTDVLGYPATGKGCTFGEFASTILVTYYWGDENISEYPYVSDILDRFNSGELAVEVFNLLREVLITDLIENEILSNLDFNPGALFPPKTLFYVFGRLLQGVTEALLGGDNSFANLIDSVLSLPVVPDGYGSINEIIDTLVVDEYLTYSQFESWGYTISWMLSSFLFDENPEEELDSHAVLTYTGPVEVEASKENFRLPSNIAVTLGDNSATQANITWITKYSVTATDIELVPYSENPEFTGKPTTGKKITAITETVDKTYPGADLGIIGLLPFSKEYVKHTIKLSGLTPGTKYSYRIGDAKRGWWSETGVIETASGGDDGFTFFYLSDPQSQRASHYETYAGVIETARKLYPDGKFVVSCGDQVDDGENFKHWNYFFNSTDEFMNLPFMPTTGNHEDEAAAISENFVLPNVPEQDEETGVFYSYDYNGVHFTVLNTNDVADDKLSDAQINWLISDIKSSDAKWKIVALHKAPYSNGSHYDDDDVIGIRNQLSALLPYLGVDMVLQGHDHVYLRTDALNGNAVVPVKTGETTFDGLEYRMKYNPKGTVYAICGTSGVKVYTTKDVEATDKLFPRAEAIVNSEYPMFSAVTVEGDSLYYNAYQVIDGEAKRVDSFGIEKTEDKSPADKACSDSASSFIANLLSKINIKYTWKFTNFVLSVVGKVMQLVWSVIK